MKTTITDLAQCDGQKLIDFDNIINDYIKVKYVDKVSVLIYSGKLQDTYDAYLAENVYR